MGKIMSGILGPLSQSVGGVTGASVRGKPTIRVKSNGGDDPKTASQIVQRSALSEASTYCRENRTAIELYLQLVEVKGMTKWQQMIKWYMAGGRLPSPDPSWVVTEYPSEWVYRGYNWKTMEVNGQVCLSLENLTPPEGWSIANDVKYAGVVQRSSVEIGIPTKPHWGEEGDRYLYGSDGDDEFGNFLVSSPQTIWCSIKVTNPSASPSQKVILLELHISDFNGTREPYRWLNLTDIIPAEDIYMVKTEYGCIQHIAVKPNSFDYENFPQYVKSLAHPTYGTPTLSTTAYRGKIERGTSSFTSATYGTTTCSGSTLTSLVWRSFEAETFESMYKCVAWARKIRIKYPGYVVLGYRLIGCAPYVSMGSDDGTGIAECMPAEYRESMLIGLGGSYDNPVMAVNAVKSNPFGDNRPQLLFTIGESVSVARSDRNAWAAIYDQNGTQLDQTDRMVRTSYSNVYECSASSWTWQGWTPSTYDSASKVKLKFTGYDPMTNTEDSAAEYQADVI